MYFFENFRTTQTIWCWLVVSRVFFCRIMIIPMSIFGTRNWVRSTFEIVIRGIKTTLAYRVCRPIIQYALAIWMPGKGSGQRIRQRRKLRITDFSVQTPGSDGITVLGIILINRPDSNFSYGPETRFVGVWRIDVSRWWRVHVPDQASVRRPEPPSVPAHQWL